MKIKLLLIPVISLALVFATLAAKTSTAQALTLPIAQTTTNRQMAPITPNNIRNNVFMVELSALVFGKLVDSMILSAEAAR